MENESESDSESSVASFELSEKDNESDTNGEHAENIEGYKNENTGVILTTSKEKFTIGVGSVNLYGIVIHICLFQIQRLFSLNIQY